MEIKLKSLRLKNFKGLKDFYMGCNGGDIEIRGDNATGKTTIFDAFLWLLFDKDSEGKSDFDIKTLDKHNNPIHKLEHEVEGVLEIYGTETIFKKVYKENWVKRRGTKEPELSGHTTECWIDEVPRKKREYDKYVSDLIGEEVFKLLTDIRYFTEKISWKERRDILTDIAAVHMDPVEMPKELKKILGNKDLEDYKKIITEMKKRLKDELKTIPIRIDEVSNSIQETEDVEIDSLKFRIRSKDAGIKTLEDEILDHSKIYEKNSKISADIYNKENRLREIKTEEKEKSEKPSQELQAEIFELKDTISQKEFGIRNSKAEVGHIEKAIKIGKNEVERLRQEWFKRNKGVISFEALATTCPTCKQDLPGEDIEERKAELEHNFNKNKQKELEEIQDAGKKECEIIKKFEAELKEQLTKIETTRSEVEQSNKKLIKKEKELKSLSEYTFIPTDEYKSIEEEIKELRSQMLEPNEVAIDELKNKKEEIAKEIEELKNQIRTKEQNEKLETRIGQLKEEEKTLANNLNDLEGQEFQIEEYTMQKINALEETVNNMFRNVKFKLFETQINGGIKEVCEILIDGVPYSSANYAGRINAGLDIISNLSKEYEIFVPVFVDNSESVTKLMDIDQQMIKLIVDGRYKKLAIIENKNIKGEILNV